MTPGTFGISRKKYLTERKASGNISLALDRRLQDMQGDAARCPGAEATGEPEQLKSGKDNTHKSTY